MDDFETYDDEQVNDQQELSETDSLINDGDCNSEFSISSMQKINQYLEKLPRFDLIQVEAKQIYAEIKENIVKSIFYNELRPGLLHWTNKLESFLSHYGFFFTKEEHLYLVKVYLELLFTPDLDFPLVEHFSNMLLQLLKKVELLTPNDLVVDWQPIYKLYLRIYDVNERSPIFAPDNMGNGFFKTFVSLIRRYFKASSTSEMLEEWRPLMCLFDTSMKTAFDRFELFMPTLMDPSRFDKGFKLWIDEFLNLWISMQRPRAFEPKLIALLSRAAFNSIGFFDWNPYIPQIFSQLLCGFSLPVSLGANGNGGGPTKSFATDTLNSIAVWLVAMINPYTTCMDHIRRLFATLRSFYYPSNTGRWSANLYMFLRMLPDIFAKRLYRERREKHLWFACIPDEYKLREEDITEFVESMKDCVFTAIFSKTNSRDAAKAFQSLCFLRPELMLPYLVDNFYLSLKSLTEPHRFTTILQCFNLVSRELIDCPSLQTHVVQLLINVLPGIDPSDINKSVITLQFLTIILTSIPIVNCSGAINVVDDLTEHERELCLITENFEHFIQGFLNKLFAVAEMLSSDTADVRHMDEFYIIIGVQATVNAIIQQSSLTFIKMIITKMKNYMSGNVFNMKAGKVISCVCRELVRSSCSLLAFKTFFLPVYENLKRIRDHPNFISDVLENERGDIELLWYLTMFAELLKSDGNILLAYTNEIEEVLGWFRMCKHMMITHFLGSAMLFLLNALTMCYPNETRLTSYLYDFDEPSAFKANFPIRDWGKIGELKNLDMQLHQPSKSELKYALDFTVKQIEAILAYLKTDMDKVKLAKEDRHRELCILNYVISGASRILKRANVPSDPDLIETNVQIGAGDYVDILLLAKDKAEVMQQAENVREDLIRFLLAYTDWLIEANTHDTKSLKAVCEIFTQLSLLYGKSRSEFDRKTKMFQSMKKKFENKSKGKHAYTRGMLMDRLLLQLEYRSFYIHTRLNSLDAEILDRLFRLSTSSYSDVRKEAQARLFDMLAYYPFSFMKIAAKIRDTLNDKNVNHDAIKGCLYILKANNMQSSLMIKHNWLVIAQIWSALFKCNSHVKPSIIALVDQVFEIANKKYDSFSYTTRLTESCLNMAFNLYSDGFLQANRTNEAIRFKLFDKKSRETIDLTHGLVNEILQLLANEQNTSWKHQTLAFRSLIFLIHPYGKLTREYVNVFVQSLVHENIQMRKLAFAGICIIIKMLKPKKEKKEYDIDELLTNVCSTVCKSDTSCPGERVDNVWHHYNVNFQIPSTNESWYAINFIDKNYMGYNCWPRKLTISQNRRHFETTANELAQPFFECFGNEEFVMKLFRLLVLEDNDNHAKNGQTRFDSKRFHLFKGLFRNFGDIIIPNLIEKHLQMLICDRNKNTFEGSHKLASEICAALIRGSKYWPLDRLKELWPRLKITFDLIVDNLAQETLFFWQTSFRVAVEDQDPRRAHFYIDYLKNLVIKKLNDDQSKTSSFQNAACLSLSIALYEFEWRIPSIRTELNEFLKQKMNHPYKVVREKIAQCLVRNLDSDVNVPNHSQIVTTAPKLNKFVDFIETKLIESMSLFSNLNETSSKDALGQVQKQTLPDEHKSALNFIQTMLNWLGVYLMGVMQPIQLDLFRLVPYLCSLDSIVIYDESMKTQLLTVRSYIASCSMNNECSTYLIEQLKKVLASENWHSKLAATQILQNYGVFNLFMMNDKIKADIKEIVKANIIDDQLEVRLACSHMLAGFIHSFLIQVDMDLIDTFKQMSKTKSKVANIQNIVKRHGGILGLCAIVDSNPYDIPSYLPDLITYLCARINDPAPIQNTVRKCLSGFRRTHHDNWQEHKQYFNEDQLCALDDLLISPNYYA